MKTSLPMVISNIVAFITAVIGIFNLFTLREAIMMMVFVSPISVWSWRVIDIVLVVILGILWLVAVFYSQRLYEKAYINKSLIKSFAQVLGLQLLLFFSASLIENLLDFEQANLQNILITSAIFIASLFLLVLPNYSKLISKFKRTN